MARARHTELMLIDHLQISGYCGFRATKVGRQEVVRQRMFTTLSLIPHESIGHQTVRKTVVWTRDTIYVRVWDLR